MYLCILSRAVAYCGGTVTCYGVLWNALKCCSGYGMLQRIIVCRGVLWGLVAFYDVALICCIG